MSRFIRPAVSWRGMARGVIALFGIGAIVWAVSAITVYQAEAGLADPAQNILQGEIYTPDQLDQLRSRLGAVQGRVVRASTFSDAAVIWLRLSDTAFVSKSGLPISMADDLDRALGSALATTPTASFLWLAEYWLQTVREGTAERGANLLRMSYKFGPHEGWIAQRRNRLALAVFTSLPDDLAKQVPAEFVGLLSSGLYADAADILAGTSGAARDVLLARLAEVDIGDRRRLARALEAKKLDGHIVPGIE